ncbi:C40 family peptidase [Desertibacillus haloalkaliphilus]|uniref:C40 family peptidase n=1 Tax=Desertibacillus haloalkaliphilus TaxID=1328930 RepID=UPI001C26B6FA|nr:C40 family peptidase [Desertibacillus haloalkaliphilus]MBU8907926.1 S-layer homology domain-containing protein [Desertibacillus haloalkaliphilus]
MFRRFTKSSVTFTLFFIVLFALEESRVFAYESIIETAKEQLGVPYQFGGTTPSGFDCSGFIGYVYRENGIELPRTANEQFQAGKSVAREDLKKGDLVFFETYQPGPSHSGIYLGEGEFISATTSSGIAIRDVDDPHYWGPRYLGARRVLEEQQMPDQQVLSELSPGSYHDVNSSHWAYSEITDLGKRGIVTGMQQSLFYPEHQLTRAQAAIIFTRIFELQSHQLEVSFTDISSDYWAAGEIAAVANAGLFNGYEDGSFRPSEPLTREQTAALLTRAFNVQKGATDVSFIDVSQTNWSYDAIVRLTASGIAGGYEDHTFRPKQTVTRAEFVVFVHRAMQH